MKKVIFLILFFVSPITYGYSLPPDLNFEPLFFSKKIKNRIDPNSDPLWSLVKDKFSNANNKRRKIARYVSATDWQGSEFIFLNKDPDNLWGFIDWVADNQFLARSPFKGEIENDKIELNTPWVNFLGNFNPDGRIRGKIISIRGDKYGNFRTEPVVLSASIIFFVSAIGVLLFSNRKAIFS